MVVGEPIKAYAYKRVYKTVIILASVAYDISL